MKISVLVEKLQQIKKIEGNLRVYAFIPEGGNSLRGYHRQLESQDLTVSGDEGAEKLFYIGELE